MAEGVGEAGFQGPGEAFPLFVGEACIAPVGGGILQIDLLMGHIQIAADNDRLGLIQTSQMIPEGFVPF